MFELHLQYSTVWEETTLPGIFRSFRHLQALSLQNQKKSPCQKLRHLPGKVSLKQQEHEPNIGWWMRWVSLDLSLD